MGNLFTKQIDKESPKPQTKSPRIGWNPDAATSKGEHIAVTATGGKNASTDGVSQSVLGKKTGLDPRDFVITGKRGEVIVRDPGRIAGQQFIVEECSDCDVYLFDHSAALTMDYCSNCRLITGPCESSLFVRNCKDCTVVTACQQFRTRDCSDCTFFLHCTTQPVVESSNRLRFGCYTLSYFSLAEHFSAAKISVWNNKWNEIYNFTGGAEDWFPLPLDAHHRDYIGVGLPKEDRERVGYTEEAKDAVVPRTSGVRGAPDGDVSFVVVLQCNIDAVLRGVLELASPTPSGCVLVRTKVFRPETAHCKELFNGNTLLLSAASCTPMLAMHWAGPGCKDVVTALLASANVQAYVASGKEGGGKHVGARDGYYMAPDNATAISKIKIVFEQWDENKGNPLA